MLRRSLLAAPLLTPFAAAAQERFPSRPVRLVIPVAVAGVTDIVGRILAEGMAAILGRPVVAENIPGAGSTVGAAAFQRSPADGYTLFIATNNHAVMKAIYPQIPFDPVADFIPLALVARQPFVLAVHPAVPARDVPELLAWLKAEGEKANYGAANPGGSNHMAGEQFRQRAGVTFTIVPYRAAAASVQDLVAGRVQLTIDSPTMLLPLIRDGRVRGLAVSTESASALVPGLPSLAEAGIAGYDMTVYQILFARPGTPPEVMATLQDAARQAIAEPSFAQRLAGVGCEPWPDSSPKAASALLAADIARMAPVVSAMKLTPG
ncbi:tripartite tricarboxylate transporter substrate binding protein [Siccirubricoccus sp. KC 17139]|uniref:Tripartite tricarboxylate transporter substrate binding protein n=1 Tax=Siccirubricoccus soli TaxID=2899147 RepID=A0ABT1CY75_9PROT|nr:tripartite tricarboxylate transporter substrate-binding protein [Siccirubricoccus soli]MCO6414609.1 tripartite tricarboxylate transporter substrate binding protein [Siccirubricoccus soli]MCP2680739.1 tripartite tricarboxylate transporter substrate-binding protein [Siccirubricoccus soli]